MSPVFIAALTIAVGSSSIALSGTALAADSLFEVAKVSIDATAKDAVTAKQKGMAEAEQRAFETVLKRLVPVSAYAQLPSVDAEDVSALVTGVAIRSERYSTTRYIATVDVSFSSQGVKQILNTYGIAFSEEQAPLLAVLPFVIENDAVGSSGEEDWRAAWEALDLAHSVTPVTIVNPRSEFTAEMANKVLGGDIEAFAALQSQYGDRPLVLAETKLEGGKLRTRLVGEDGVGNINHSSEIGLGGRSAREAARDAAEIAFGVLENRWKVTQSTGVPPSEGSGVPDPAPPETSAAPQVVPGIVPRNLVAIVEFSGLRDWQDMRARLMNVPGLQALEVNSLSARSAAVTFDYGGSLGQLQSALGGAGFTLEDRDGDFVVRAR